MRRFIRFALPAIVIVAGSFLGIPGEEKQPVYVGARVCAECHAGQGMGNQFSHWLLSEHSEAYASLATPEAKEMARLSGIPGEPQETPACLGCHATASDAEQWEKDSTFLIEDGVQCERCHGPGSEYMAEDVMRDREASVKAGLRFPAAPDCILCHYEKGSHVAVHNQPQVDVVRGRKTIGHPTPENATMGSLPQPPRTEGSESPGPAYVGVKVCAGCHRGPEMGYQYSRWRLGVHSEAWAVLATPTATEIARDAGIDGAPQESPECMKCHVTGGDDAHRFAETYSVADGVGCEACHGPGSEYLPEAIMRDPRAARDAGLEPVTRDTCLECHGEAHGKPFDPDPAMQQIAHPSEPPEFTLGLHYKTPVNLALSPDGKELFIACEASSSVIVVDALEREKIAEIPVGGLPNDVTFAPDGRTAYVTNRLDDSVSVIDVDSHQVVRTFPVGDDPHGLLTDPSGRFLYVLNTAAESISVIETSTFEEVKVLSASRNPWSLSLSPDGRQIFVTNNLSRFVEFREPSVSEVTVIDAELGVVEDRLDVRQTNLVQGVSWHPDGELAFITMNRTKNLVPMTRVLQGWTITNGIGILWRDGRVDQVLLDEPNLYFPDAADVAVSPDGRYALVTSSGSDRVAVVDVARLVSMLEAASEREREEVLPNHLGKSAEFVVKYIPTELSPRGILVSHDGATAFVANSLDDSVTVIDMESLEAVERVDLGGPKEITKARWGEQLFHSADIAFQRQFSCHSCHPDGHVDGITYDIEPDGIGFDPVDNRTLRGILDTAPFKWSGKNKDLPRQCGPRLAVFFTRVEPFKPDELAAVAHYISTIPRPPNRHRPHGADLTDAQRRGKKMFERATTNDGRAIPPEGRCVTCHFPPLYTNRTVTDVGSKMELDKVSAFDVPHLTNIYDSAPYMHNGISETLEEIWTRYNPEDKHGVTNDMTKDQLNDLIEYLKTL